MPRPRQRASRLPHPPSAPPQFLLVHTVLLSIVPMHLVLQRQQGPLQSRTALLLQQGNPFNTHAHSTPVCSGLRMRAFRWQANNVVFPLDWDTEELLNNTITDRTIDQVNCPTMGDCFAGGGSLTNVITRVSGLHTVFGACAVPGPPSDVCQQDWCLQDGA